MPTQFTTSTLSVGFQQNAVTAADFNGDGKIDFAFTGLGTNQVLTGYTGSSGFFETSELFSVGGQSIDVDAADVNGDGKVDQLVLDASNQKLLVRINNGSGFDAWRMV